MTLPVIDYAAPETLEEALALLAARPASRPLGGGQRLVNDLRARRSAPGLLVDLTRIAALQGVRGRPGGRLEIGAATTLVQAAEDPAVAARPVLAQTLAAVADPQVRNRATIGGAVCAGARADLAAALLVLDAEVETAGAGGRHLLPAAAPRPPHQLVTAVHLPAPEAGSRSAYERVMDPASLAPLVGVAVSVRADPDGLLASIRVALTGALPSAVRLPDVEAALHGAGAPYEAAGLVSELGLAFLDDAAASAGYRRHLVGVLLTRALHRALA